MAETVAILGTGVMGAPIARNAAKAGLDVRAWNRTTAKARPLEQEGVTVADEAADAVRGAGVVVTMLTDTAAVSDVMRSAADALSDGAAWVQMSTVGIAGTERLAELARELGLRYLDSPVSGTRKPAEDGALVILASGDASVRDQAGDLLGAIGAKVVWLGEEPGTATRMKLALNAWLVSLTTAAAETLALAEGLGLEARQVLDILKGGPLDLPYLQLKGGMMLAREYPVSFPLSHASKDAVLVLEAAERAHVGLPVARAAAKSFDRADQDGHGGDDMAAVFEAVPRS